MLLVYLPMPSADIAYTTIKLGLTDFLICFVGFLNLENIYKMYDFLGDNNVYWYKSY